MVLPGRDRLSGTVEADETYIGGKKSGKGGRGAAGKSLVLIAVEDKDNDVGRIRLQRVIDTGAESLIPAVQASRESGSTVRTDGWSIWRGVSSKGYTHIVARQSADVGENLLPLVKQTGCSVEEVAARNASRCCWYLSFGLLSG